MEFSFLPFLTGAASLFYLLVLGIFSWGVLRLRPRGKEDCVAPGGVWPSVTVVAPMRNEEKNVAQLLNALAQQQYPGEWEVICVDDRSTDRTQELLRTYSEKDQRFKLLVISPDEPVVASPKKRALERAFATSQSEILMTIDADCIPPDCWMRSMVSCFQEGIDIVQGPKQTQKKEGVINSVQALETLGFTLIEAAFFSLGKPMLASAPSLAYRRKVYEAAGGLAALGDHVSGDDDMLVQRMRHFASGVAYNADAEAQVVTIPVSTWCSFFEQRARWASNGTRYESKSYVALLFLIYLFFVLLALSPAVAWWAGSLVPLLLIVAKTIGDLIFLYIGGKRLRSLSLLKAYPITYFFQVIVVLWSPIAGFCGWYDWKGNRKEASISIKEA